MNINIVTLIEYFVGSLFICLGGYTIGGIILNKKFSINLKIMFKLIFLAILTIINSLIFDNIIKVLGVLAIIFCLYYFLYKEKISKCLILSILTYIFTLCGETTIALFASIFMLFKIDIVLELSKLFLVNFFVSLLAVGYSYLFRNIIKKFIRYIDKNNMIYTFILGLILIFILMSSLYNILFVDLVINYKFILNLIIILGCVSLSVTLIVQYMKKSEILNKYNLLNEYLKTSAELIEKYSTTMHKYKNNLIAIKGYMRSDYNKALDYIDSLLDSYSTKKYNWFSKINYIKIDTIRYLIYYKLSKAEETNLKIFVNVSTDIKKYDNEILNLNEIGTLVDILGEYFDNAIYAAKESKEQELNFGIYVEEEKIVFVLANTYINNIDLSLIVKNGYTTKGKGHGLGLYDIEKTIRTISNLQNDYKLENGYFIVTLSLDLNIKKEN